MLRKGRRGKPGTLSLYKPHTDSQAEVTALMPVACVPGGTEHTRV